MKNKKISEYLARIGKTGGKKSLKTMTAKQRKQRSSRAAKARWVLSKGGPVKARRRKGSIYKEPGCATWTIAYRRDGKRIREYTGFEDFNAAQQKLAQRLAQCDRGERIDTGRGPTCADLWVGLVRHYLINGRKSAECLGRRWKHLQRTFGEVAAGQVAFDRLEDTLTCVLASTRPMRPSTGNCPH